MKEAEMDRRDPPSPTTATVPPQVSSLAAERRLGELIAVQKMSNPIVHVVIGLAVSTLGSNLANLVVWGTERLGITRAPALAYLTLFGVFLLVYGLVYAVRALIRGFRTCYLYEGGLVWRRNRFLRAAPWPEVETITVREGRGWWLMARERAGFAVSLKDGQRFFVPAAEGSTFGRRILETAVHAGVHVTA